MPMTGVLEAFNAYEIQFRVNKKCFIVYKHAIATIEVVVRFPSPQKLGPSEISRDGCYSGLCH